MGKLKVLPSAVANMIAAGEVVQRPASVVKELMENAIDAGATRVKVSVSDAGRTLIQVIDDGVGMSASDAVLCFERHATSKISEASDLQRINTYGFRGEALASIAAVSEVTLKTRRESDETGTMVEIRNSGEVRSSSTACPAGSSFAVRNLFYNTPARRKFLKSDNVELRHIIDEFTRVALTRPDIAFTLSHNSRDLFVLKAAKSLKFRVLDLLGSSVVSDIVDLDTTTSTLGIKGFVGRPDTARKTPGNQFFFVNGRFFRSPYLHKAVMKAYEGLIAEGVTPSYFIYLDIDPSSIDVNISPTKTEVKFEDDSVVFQILVACIKETLGRNAFGAGIDFETQGAVEIPSIGSSFEQYKDVSRAPAPAADPLYNPFSEMPGSPDFEPGPPAYVDRRDDYGKLFEDKVMPGRGMITVKGKYIVTQAASGMMVVNIRRAWERILYEKFLKAVSSGEHVTQVSLFPVQVEVGVSQRLLFEEHADVLHSLGFDIAPFGNSAVVVNGVPEGFSCEEGKVSQMVSDMSLLLSEDRNSLPEIIQSRMAEKFAVLGSFNVEAPSSEAETRRLLDTLFAGGNADFTPSGKRITAVIGVEEIDKKF